MIPHFDPKDSPHGPRLAHLGLLAEYFKTTIDALVNPDFLVDDLSSAGRPATLTQDEEEILRLVRRIGPKAAMDRLLVLQSSPLSHEQVRAIVDDEMKRYKP